VPSVALDASSEISDFTLGLFETVESGKPKTNFSQGVDSAYCTQTLSDVYVPTEILYFGTNEDKSMPPPTLPLKKLTAKSPVNVRRSSRIPKREVDYQLNSLSNSKWVCAGFVKVKEVTKLIALPIPTLPRLGKRVKI
jgi:hypothetical protein